MNIYIKSVMITNKIALRDISHNIMYNEKKKNKTSVSLRHKNR